MKWQGHDPYRRYIITGKVVQEGEKGKTLEDERGVRHYIITDRLIGPINPFEYPSARAQSKPEGYQHDLFAPLD